MSIFRVTGKAGAVKVRTGSNDNGPWTMRSQPVEISQFVVTDVSLTDDHAGYAPGEDVDLAVEVTAKGGFIRTEIRGDWPKPAAAHVRAAS